MEKHKKTILSGLQPSGDLHIGNHLGSIKQNIDIHNSLSSDDNRFLFMLADLHTITVPQDPALLRKTSIEHAAWYIASGLDPERTILFQQSHNADHPYAAWIFDCIVPMGWMERMTQYKEKSQKQGERTSVGLFHYPSLMAADILLYDTDIVPVGEDQTQHLELTRDIAKKFNARYKNSGVGKNGNDDDILTIPKVMVYKDAARIMSLQDPTSKMSKSDDNKAGCIHVLDNPDEIRRKVMRAVTDSGEGIRISPDKPGISNLIRMYAAVRVIEVQEVERLFENATYGEFKAACADVIIDMFSPIQETYYKLMSNESYIVDILREGSLNAQKISSVTLSRMKEAVGFL